VFYAHVEHSISVTIADYISLYTAIGVNLNIVVIDLWSHCWHMQDHH